MSKKHGGYLRNPAVICLVDRLRFDFGECWAKSDIVKSLLTRAFRGKWSKHPLFHGILKSLLSLPIDLLSCW